MVMMVEEKQSWYKSLSDKQKKEYYQYHNDKNGAKKLGIGIPEYKALHRMPKCWICGNEDTGKKNVHDIEHCHEELGGCGKIRWVTCSGCNQYLKQMEHGWAFTSVPLERIALILAKLQYKLYCECEYEWVDAWREYLDSHATMELNND